jgi:hypothetical protein
MQRGYAKNQAAIRLGKDWRPVLVLRRAIILSRGSRHRDQKAARLYCRPPPSSSSWRPGSRNKVPACSYCNSHKGSRSVEQFRQWVHALVFDKANRDGAPLGKQRLGRWKIKAGAVVFYFELARLSNSGSNSFVRTESRISGQGRTAAVWLMQRRSATMPHVITSGDL